MFWSSISTAERNAIEIAGVRKSYESGTVLFFDHDPPTHVLVLIEGEVKLSRVSMQGREILIELRGPGTLVGELAAIDDTPRVATAKAVSRVEAIVVPTPAFQELLRQHNGICLATLTLVAEKLRQATNRRLAGRSATLGRLAGRLVEMASYSSANENGVIHIDSPLTQQEMAEWIGVSRDAVVLALRTMRTNGWIESGRRTIEIYDLPALRACAEHY